MQQKKPVRPNGQRPSGSQIKRSSVQRKSTGRTIPPATQPGGHPAATRPPSRRPSAGKPGKRKPPSRTQEISNLQRRRRKKHKRNYTLYYILLFLFLIITGTVLSLTVFFNIETITVQGSKIYTSADVLPVLGVKEGDNLLRIRTGKMEEELLQMLPQADQVEINREFPSGLVVNIADGNPSAQIESDGKYYTISQSGRILEQNDHAQSGNGVVIVGVPLEKAIVGDYVQDVLERNWQEASALAEEQEEDPPEKSMAIENLEILFSALEKAQFSEINAVDVSDEINVIIYWQNRIEIKLGSFSELDYKLQFVKEVLTDEAYAQIIPVDACGILDAQAASSVMPFQPQDAITVPGGGAGVWNWDDNLSDTAMPEEELGESSIEESVLESIPEPSPQSEENSSSDPIDSSAENP